ncbi:CRISPR-associated endonuclease/helicase Cas3 [Nocardiopsis mwathae]|uniref:CRISPR-associated endonuclease/helicase Cas3 n=1 Tax=Nocardiopsis mwathae TaxID=1472723 RepID=A0A7X0D822_9ACTN|nr:CRISPR-associated helicase Cas3' [Nocardiopsis mwathae]MBB6174935.1 CRISPR-associated endonuclease/helicase Cas3 [Nocardiopsis mwathae]
MSELERVWAKSPEQGSGRGELLTEHLSLTRDALETVRTRLGRIPSAPERFWTWALLACLFHDPGKIPDGFQRMVGNPPPKQPWGRRHEIYSLGFIEHVLAQVSEEERIWVGLGALTHHRPLTGGERSIRKECTALLSPEQVQQHFGPINERAATELAVWLADQAGVAPPQGPLTAEQLAHDTYRLLHRVRDEWEDESPDDAAGMAAVLLQGAVTLADHVASAHSELLIDHPLPPDYPDMIRWSFLAQGRTLFSHQWKAEHVHGHTLLRAPTGRGKTEAGLLWAATQITDLTDDGRGLPRLFYTLPYLASINAMSTRLGEDLDDPRLERIGITHSRAAAFHMTHASCDEHDEPDGDHGEDRAGHSRKGTAQRRRASRAIAKANASRLYRELLRVTTPYPLLRGALGGTTHSATLLDAANSVFIFDELHAYDPQRLGMVLAMMRQWEQLGGRIGIISATIPEALEEAIGEVLEGTLHCVEPDDAHPWPVRHRLALREPHLTDPKSLQEIEQSLRSGKSVAVIANNVADASFLYEQLAPVARDLFGPDAALLLHARFKNQDRAEIERKLQGRYGAGACPRRPGLLVATQVVEVSLNVDFDLLHTSAATLEALIQRFGRTNRLGWLNEPAPVIVHHPHYAPRHNGPDEFADKVYPKAPTQLGWEILTRHDGRCLDERLFTHWLNEVYSSDWGSEWRAQVEDARKLFHDSFLTFLQPFDDNAELARAFDGMFNGIDGILEGDEAEYRRALSRAERTPGEQPGTGRLLASQLLIPLPDYARSCGRWAKDLDVLVIDATYDSEYGLRSMQRATDPRRPTYVPGELV